MSEYNKSTGNAQVLINCSPELNDKDRMIWSQIQWFVSAIKLYPEREHLRATLQALVSENALDSQNKPRGLLLTMLFWRYPQYIELRPVADALGVMPSSLKTALGLDGVK